MQEYPGEWLTAPLESDSTQNSVFVTGRTDVKKFRDNTRFSVRINVTMTYGPTVTGLPDTPTGEIINEITDRLVDIFTKDPVAVLTGIYTGDNERTWVFYTPSTNIFQRKFNEALADLPLYPITMTAENDPAWEEYDEMMQALL